MANTTPSSNLWALKGKGTRTFAQMLSLPDANLRQQHSQRWLRDQAQNVTSIDTSRLTQTMADRFTSKLVYGRLYLYWYDPKLKEKLPYYDRFPLVFPIDAKEDGGFLGLNLHYLPYMARARLMDALYTTLNNKKMDETTKIRASYGIIKNAAKFRLFRPCIKHYLRDHIESRFLNIPADQWDIALFLPLERFTKATKQRVWSESMRKVRH